MKQESLRTLLLGLQLTAIGSILFFSSFFFLSFRTANRYLDLWQQLGISKDNGTNNIRESFLYGSFRYWGARNLRHIAAGDRGAVAYDLLEYTRQYVQSETFKKAYAQHRQESKPQPPAAAATEEATRNRFIEDTKKSIADVEKTIKTADPDMKKMFQETLDLLKEQLKGYQDPNNEMIKMIAEGDRQQYQMKQNEFQENMKKWEVEMPESPDRMIRQRLTQLLEATEGIDYGAELIQRNNKQYFAKQEYERKPAYWKMGFRAGREVTEKVRAYAKQWLASLGTEK